MRFLLFIGVVWLTGCSTYGQSVEDGLDAFKQGNLPVAITEMERKFGDSDNDQLLRHMELGLLKHLAGQYPESNQHLHQAERIAEALYTKQMGDMVAVGLSNPRNGPYRGVDFEKVFIHYYKAMNYLQLSMIDSSQRRHHLEAARVETRKVDILLTAISNERGDYQEQRDRKKQLFSRFMDVFKVLTFGNTHREDYVYREDAYLRYITGVIYELNGEYDDARIAYQKAATLYETGFAEQFGLPHTMTEQAWLDTVRMMEQVGGYDSEADKLKRDKLTEQGRQRLGQFSGNGQLLVVLHVGMIPHREELNLHAMINPFNRQLEMRLLAVGNQQQRREQFAWFYAMYADRGLLEIINSYQAGGLFGLYESGYTMRRPLGPVWGTVESSGLLRGMNSGIRVTLPYYPVDKAQFADSTLQVNGGEPVPLIAASSLARLALQQQLVSAGQELAEALAREAVKNTLVQKAADEADLGLLGSFAGQLLTALTSAAETRNWLTLPHTVRIQRIPLSPGEHSLSIETRNKRRGLYDRTVQQVKINPGELQLLVHRSLPMNQQRADAGQPLAVTDLQKMNREEQL